MSDPLKWQRQFLDAVLSLDPDALIAGVTGRVPAAISTIVYRNNILEGFRAGLKDIYRTTAALVGDDCFQALAHDYVRETPSLCGDRSAYGIQFSDWLAEHHAVRQLVYLVDVARLDWACHEAHNAADTFLRCGVHATVRMVGSAYPLWSIWRVCQDPESEAVLDLDRASGEQVLVARPHDAVVIRALDPAEAIWYRALLRGRSLRQAIVIAQDAAPGEDIEGYWHRAQRDGLMTSEQDH
ncbi:DNA-binding domain-containing protein [Acidiferrobacter thiooxydans]|uniref:HvfC/BufC N-terminal domain-containing protein n=1 Tax=Acidiferrobacter thiooxydans TaxID=163359 RepID=UPI000824249A|nr:DNA-binding domain-containing protein [Acidiferrobacter thiooxydans]UEO00450.1 DNA-binding domain-containing protein [Acidiferrobacter thiooxydans]